VFLNVDSKLCEKEIRKAILFIRAMKTGLGLYLTQEKRPLQKKYKTLMRQVEENTQKSRKDIPDSWIGRISYY
jgi:hypothetical protein